MTRQEMIEATKATVLARAQKAAEKAAAAVKAAEALTDDQLFEMEAQRVAARKAYVAQKMADPEWVAERRAKQKAYAAKKMADPEWVAERKAKQTAYAAKKKGQLSAAEQKIAELEAKIAALTVKEAA